MVHLKVAFAAGLLLLLASPNANASVWRCHTPTGDVWTDQPQGYGDCEEFAGTYNPGAAPPTDPSPPVPPAPEQVIPPPPPPTFYDSAPPPPYPPYYEPYSYYDPYYYSPYGPGVYLYPPWFGFRFGHSPRFGRGGHFGGQRFGGVRGFSGGSGQRFGGGRSFSGGGGRGFSGGHGGGGGHSEGHR
ncbi:MAG: hypothetical protein ABJB49_03295 [Nitrospirota bacterium]